MIFKIRDLAKDSVFDGLDEDINKESSEYDKNTFFSAGLYSIEL